MMLPATETARVIPQHHNDEEEREDRSTLCLKDICETLSVPGKYLHVAFAEAGTNDFKTGEAFERITPLEYQKICNQNRGVSFISCVEQSAPTDKRIKKEHVKAKNLISFDIDLKDFIPDIKSLSTEAKRAKCKEILDQARTPLEAVFGPVWLAVFSGNGLHLHFRLRALLPIDSQQWKAVYMELVTHAQKALPDGVTCDGAFSDIAHLIRLPLSTNRKLKTNQINTKILAWNGEADSSDIIRGLVEKITEDLKVQQKVVPIFKFNGRSNGNQDKERIRDALTFEATFSHFGCDKSLSTAKPLNATTMRCSSPFKSDSDASFDYTPSTKLWCDRSNANNGGDVFDLIAELKGIDCERDFPEVLKIARQITGIHEPVFGAEAKSDGPAKEKSKRGKKKHRFYEEYKKVISELFPDIRKDIISLEVYGREATKKDLEPLLSKSVLGYLRSHFNDLEDYAVTRTEDQLHRLARDLEPSLLIDTKPPDGRDRIHEIIKRCTFSNLTPEHAEELIKEWLAKTIQRIDDPKVQNTALIFAGQQGIGKDRIIKTLVGGFGRYLKEPAVNIFKGNEKELSLTLTTGIVFCFSEFDRTNAIDSATLKDVITKESVNIRPLYGQVPLDYPLRHSLIGSTNHVNNLFRDSSGARRFTILDFKGPKGEAIQWGYPDSIEDQQQILAQAIELAAQNFTASREAHEAMSSYLAQRIPEDSADLIVSDFVELMKERNLTHIKSTSLEFEDIFGKLKVIHGVHERKIQTTLKQNGCDWRDKRGRGYQIPQSDEDEIL